MISALAELDTLHAVLLVVCLATALGFEFVNGFHDTANAVATVIYTHTLRPWAAVILSGLCNFLGVFFGGIAVAIGIMKLLPVELLVERGATGGIAMVLALLVSAMMWNLSTWYLGLPASSSHTLIGAILGVGLINGVQAGHPLGYGVNWTKASEIGLSLLVSPVLGFLLAGGLLLLVKRLAKNPALFAPPPDKRPPPTGTRALLVLTCSGVSFEPKALLSLVSADTKNTAGHGARVRGGGGAAVGWAVASAADFSAAQAPGSPSKASTRMRLASAKVRVPLPA
jgi:phosphate/sulfate permease